jgi:GntR family transcriptional regulator
VHIQVNIESGIPIYLQIASQVKELAASGALRKGEQLPSVRALALRLRINPNTVQAAYRHLESEGVVKRRQGLGVFLAGAVKKMQRKEKVVAVRSIIDQAVFKAHQLGLDMNELTRLLKERIKAFPESPVSGKGDGGYSHE